MKPKTYDLKIGRRTYEVNENYDFPRRIASIYGQRKTNRGKVMAAMISMSQEQLEMIKAGDPHYVRPLLNQFKKMLKPDHCSGRILLNAKRRYFHWLWRSKGRRKYRPRRTHGAR